MALFKPRKGGDELPTAPPASESVDAARKRARHRLIGAALLVLAGVIGFPLLFDTQPRPIAVDIPIEIPDKNKVRPMASVVTPSLPAPAVSAVARAAPAVPPKTPEKLVKAADASANPVEAKDAAVAPKSGEKTAALVIKPTLPAVPTLPALVTPDATKKAATSDSKDPPKSADAAKAQALLDATTTERPSAAETRFVVQVGAFADAALAKEARSKLERAGLKTYTTVVETKEGQRTRVRVGPFADKTDADTAASKIKALDLPAAILVL